MTDQVITSPTSDNMDDDLVIDTVKVLCAQQREIVNLLSRQDLIMTELQ